MTVGQFIEQVFILLNGGSITQDTNVRREDIRNYIPAVANYYIVKQYYLNKQDGESLMPSDFIATYEDVPVVYSPQRAKSYIILPQPLVTLPKDIGLQTIGAMQGSYSFARLPVQAEGHLANYFPNVPDTVWFMLEGNKVYFINLPKAVTAILVRTIVNINSLSDNDYLPIPSGDLADALDRTVKFFLPEVQLPADVVNDNIQNKA